MHARLSRLQGLSGDDVADIGGASVSASWGANSSGPSKPRRETSLVEAHDMQSSTSSGTGSTSTASQLGTSGSVTSLSGLSRASRSNRPKRSKSLKYNSNSATKEALRASLEQSRRASRSSHSRQSSSKLQKQDSLHNMELLQSMDALDQMERNPITDSSSRIPPEQDHQDRKRAPHRNTSSATTTGSSSSHHKRPSLHAQVSISTQPNVPHHNNTDNHQGSNSSLNFKYDEDDSSGNHHVQINNPYLKKAVGKNSASSGLDTSRSNLDCSTSSFQKGSTHFSTNSSVLARRFLQGDEDDDSSHGPLETFHDEPSSRFHHDNNHGSNSSYGQVNDLEWNPELQRRQQDEWRRQQIQRGGPQCEPNHDHQHNHSGDGTSFGGSGSFFPSRPDLRDVDQTINLMTFAHHSQGTSKSSESGEDDPPPPSRRSRRNSANDKRSRSGDKHDSNGLTFMGQMNNSLVDIFLDKSAQHEIPGIAGGEFANHKRRGKKKRKSHRGKNGSHYDERTCCQDLWCSRMTIVLVVAALLGAFVAWRTGAFWPTEQEHANASSNATVAPSTVASLEKDINQEAVATTSDEQTMQELKELLLSLNLVSDFVMLERSNPLTPQHLALNWVASIRDLSVLASEETKSHQLMHPAPDGGDNQGQDSASDSAVSLLSSEDCLRLVAYALAVLYYSTNNVDGKSVFKLEDDPATISVWVNHDNWMTRAPLCQWHGVQCNTNAVTGSTVVSQLNLTQNYLCGTLPAEVSHILFSLTVLDLSANQLTGTLPSDMIVSFGNEGNPAPPLALEQLLLKENQFIGTVPNSWGSQLTKLQRIEIGHNQLFGTLPLEIDQWTNLKMLALENNQFTGKFPYIEMMTHLGM
jgi:hypothetical protein